MRAMVASSKRSVLYSKRQTRPPGSSMSLRDKSNFEVFVSTTIGVLTQPGMGERNGGSRVNNTWKSGFWPTVRSGCNSLTRYSKGTS